MSISGPNSVEPPRNTYAMFPVLLLPFDPASYPASYSKPFLYTVLQSLQGQE